jgi:hypothetical protein
MPSNESGSTEDVVYISHSTSGAGPLQFESSAMPTSLATIVRDAFVFYPDLAILVATPRTPGLQPGSIWTRDDFDEPLSDEFWAGDE